MIRRATALCSFYVYVSRKDDTEQVLILQPSGQGRHLNPGTTSDLERVARNVRC
jgi:hypothetical protein